MTLHCAFIGFGKSTTRYHLPYVLHRKDRWQVAHIYRRRQSPRSRRRNIPISISPAILMTC